MILLLLSIQVQGTVEESTLAMYMYVRVVMLRNVDHVWKYMYLASCLSFISHEHGARFSTLTSACGLQGLRSYTDSPTVSAVDFILQLLHILQAMQSWAGPGNKIAPGAFRVCRARAATCGVEQ